MYDSLAAELREKLGGRGPLLLPPRDYDTMQRSHGNVDAVDERRCLNPRIVCGGGGGKNVRNATKRDGHAGNRLGQHNDDNWDNDEDDDDEEDDGVVVGRVGPGGGANNSCGQSSGIGSDSAGSPIQEANNYSHQLDDRSSSGTF